MSAPKFRPGGRPLIEQVAEVHRSMLRMARGTRDPEVDHIQADNELTRLVSLLAYDHPSLEARRLARLILRAYNRVTRYCA